MSILQSVKELEEQMIQDRRYLHRNPELSFHEINTDPVYQRTVKRISGEIEKFPMETGVRRDHSRSTAGKNNLHSA